MVLSWKCSRFGPFQFLSRQWQSIQIIYIITILVVEILFSNSYQLNFDKKENNNKSTLITRAYLIWQTDQLFYMILLGEILEVYSNVKNINNNGNAQLPRMLSTVFMSFIFFLSFFLLCLVEQTALANRWKFWSFLWPNNGL